VKLVRMVNISQSLGMKTVFIRYNPDSYKLRGKRQRVSTTERHRELKRRLDNFIHCIKSEDLEFLSDISFL
jgi:hypothetical protein